MFPLCQIFVGKKNASSQPHSGPRNLDPACSTAVHARVFFSHFLSIELCSSDFKSAFPIVSLENTRKKGSRLVEAGRAPAKSMGSAEALALCEGSQRLFMCCRDAGLCRAGNLPAPSVCRDYRHFSRHQSFKGNGTVTGLDKGKGSAGFRQH